MKRRKAYGDELKTKRFSTQRDMKNAMRQVLLPRFGNRRMEGFKTGEVQIIFDEPDRLAGRRQDPPPDIK